MAQATVKFVDNAGYHWELAFTTGEGDEVAELSGVIQGLPTWLKKHGFNPTASQKAAPVPQQKQSGGYEQSKQGGLDMLTVKPNGKFEFEVSGARYPLKDARGPQVVKTLFSATCFNEQFTEHSLEQPGVFTPQHFGALTVVYAKSASGYWDILEIHPS